MTRTTSMACSLLALLLAPACLPLRAQSPSSGTIHDPTRRSDPWLKKGSKSGIPANERILRITVRDEKGEIVPGAVLTLKNLLTGATKKAIATSNGTYTFNALDRRADHELIAESKGMKSDLRKVSQYLPEQIVSITVQVKDARQEEAKAGSEKQ